MPGETLSFPIEAPDRASKSFRDVGDAALSASGKIDIAAASLALWDDTSQKSKKGNDTLIASKLAVAKADTTLAKAETFVSGEADKATSTMRGLIGVTDDSAKSAGNAAKGFSGLAGQGFGGGATGMGALIGAGVALLPIVTTVTFGLTGLAAAAYGIYKPISNAEQATGGLAKNMHTLGPEQQTVAKSILNLGVSYAAFQNALQPTVLGLFNRGLQLATVLMHNLEPVSAAVGKALGTMVGQISGTFQDGTWQGFFTFMQRTAAPDVQLLSRVFTTLMNALPPLVEEMQPVSTSLARITGSALELIGVLAKANQGLDTTGQHMNFMQKTTALLRTVLFAPGAGLLAALKLLHIDGGPAAKALAETSTAAQMSAVHVQNMATAVGNLNKAESTALSTLVTYSGDILTSAADAGALQKALKASGDQVGVHTAAQRASFSAANTYITDLSNQAQAAIAAGKGTDGAIAAIRRGLPILDQAKSKNRLYWQEVQTLVGWLHRLQALKNIQDVVVVRGSGSWTMHNPANQSLPGGYPGGVGAAAGMMVRGGTPGRDSVLISAMPGELVVPTSMVKAGAVDHLRGSIPGFAGGGIVPSYKGPLGGVGPWAAHNWSSSVKTIESDIAQSFAQVFAASQGSPGFGIPPSGPLQNYAKALLAAYGWSSQWPQFADIVARESGWNVYATNPTSGAYGIPQALPGWKMASAGGDWRTNGFTQLRWMAGYLKSRWGSPAAADANEQAFHWYDNGGVLKPGLTLAYNGTGRPEMVIPHRGGGAGHIVLEVHGGAGEFEQFMATFIRKYVRLRGGNVQTVFGRT